MNGYSPFSLSVVPIISDRLHLSPLLVNTISPECVSVVREKRRVRACVCVWGGCRLCVSDVCDRRIFIYQDRYVNSLLNKPIAAADDSCVFLSLPVVVLFVRASASSVFNVLYLCLSVPTDGVYELSLVCVCVL